MRSIKVLTGSALAVAFFIIMAAVVYAAPEATDEIHGSIKDALGRPLSGASLVLKSATGTIIGKTQSDADGNFVFTSVPPGSYAVMAEKTGFQAGTAKVTVEAGTIAIPTLTLAAHEALEMSVVAERLNQARNNLSPKTGGSEYSFTQSDVTALPEGEDTALNQVLLQAPGVANDSYGQLHVRGDHANIQYRFNGIILPEGITGFGQALDSRIFESMDLLTGALPAQYGLRTAGVVEIQTKAYYETAGRIDFWGGSNNTLQPSFEYGGTKGNVTYYLSGTYLHSDLGIENPTSSPSAIHDETQQYKGFAYISYLIDPTTRVSFLFGSYDGYFQIPNNPGQPITNSSYLTELGLNGYNSAALNENQYENNRYGVVALQSSIGPDFDYQISTVTHYTSVSFTPDPIGDLVFNGVASTVFESSLSQGLQGDGSYRLNAANTVRMGFFTSYENTISNNTSVVFPVDAAGNATGPAYPITDNNTKSGNTLLSLYLQDEWKPSKKWTVNYGLRYDEMDAYTEASQLSPRVGTVYKVTPETTLHAAYAREFTPPPTELVLTKTVNLFAGTSNLYGFSTENSPVQPERDDYFDVGATQKVTSSLNVGIDYYNKRTRQLIDEGQFGQALIFTPFNYSQGKIDGLELTVNYRSGNFSSYANFARTVSEAKEVTSAQFNFAPDELAYIADNWIHCDHDQLYTASAGVSYLWLGTLLTSDATFGSGLRAGFANTQALPSNTQVNVGAVRKFTLASLGPMEARVAVLNVFDKSNIIRNGTGIGVFAPQYGPRIGFFAGLSKLF